ncbi:MAG TPA: amylo-alpha-1,6-glucosidase [Actinomycetes bacterium]|nr:amylo-alpha-1,6-glucosidase [Actinomycetes bacterium]
MVAQKVTSPEGEVFELADKTAVPSGPAPASAHSERVEQLWSTKEGDVFLCADPEGNLNPTTSALVGLYCKDTRFLSELMLLIDGRVPLLLSTSTERVFMSHVDLSNQELVGGEEDVIAPLQTVNVRRTRVIRDRLYERVRLKSYHAAPIQVRVTMTFGADFADIFEVRGFQRTSRGKLVVPKADRAGAVFGYCGEDGLFRQTRITFEHPADKAEVRGGRVVASWRLELAPDETQLISFEVEPRIGEERMAPKRFDAATHELRRSYETWERDCTRIRTSNELFDTLLARGRRDLRALMTPTPHGDIVAAGIPWFVAPFGRDALISSHQLLMLNPDVARSTLAVLAAYQGDKLDPWRDEEPGKILHELRQGELARSGALPHTPYYGSIDSTPLWLVVLGSYWRWTGDLGFCRQMLPHVERALEWMDRYGDRDGDGFLEYERASDKGLANQGWKDSHNSVVHADGSLAAGPIALAEVQAYAYLARLRASEIFEALGQPERARALRAAAESLRKSFNDAFWMESEQYFALALDGDKRQVATVTSNPAHGLYCDIVDPDKAGAMARRLLAPDMFSGWGIRTMSKSARAYNPMSYHNGSIWPHDNALIAAGLKRYGYGIATNRVATALFDMAVTAQYMRLPELFCGFTRRTPNLPVAYPVACLPQAWAAGAPFQILQAMLGLSARAPDNAVTVNKPLLPPWLDDVELRNLRVGGSTISVSFTRQGETTGFSLLGKQGDIRVLMEE